MKYRAFIERYFQIDKAETGELVPFLLNRVQNKYYDELQKDYDIEGKGIESALREIVLKARKEGFSSLVLAIFAADDILQENATETLIISYKDDGTKTFRRRYKNFILSYFASKWGIQVNQIDEKLERTIFQENENGNYVLRHNKAHFYCGTASGRTAERGGTTQKLLFSEAAHYPDKEVLTAREIIEGTASQVAVNSGMIFIESTANGYGNHYEKTWSLAKSGQSRYKPRFYGWREFYTEEEYVLVASGFTDKQMLKQEYPENDDEAFIFSGSPFFDNEQILKYISTTKEPISRGEISLEGITPKYEEMMNGELEIWEYPRKGNSYVLGADTAEGLVDGDWSVAKVIDNRSLRTVASLRTHVSPDKFEKMVFALGVWYNEAYIAVEGNKDGLWVNTELFNSRYPNLYFREEIDDITMSVKKKVGWITSMKTRPVMLAELRRMLNQIKDCWNDKGFLEECLTFVRGDNGRPDAMTGKHDDQIIALAIALEVRKNAPMTFEVKDPGLTPLQEVMIARLEARYGKKVQGISQRDYI